MGRIRLMNLVAASDATFERRGGDWVGRCLLCNGAARVHQYYRRGASLEHIRACARGETDALENLAILHPTCNWEKGSRWDPRRRRSEADYEHLWSVCYRSEPGGYGKCGNEPQTSKANGSQIHGQPFAFSCSAVTPGRLRLPVP